MTDMSLEQNTVVLNGHTVGGWSDDADAFSTPDVELLATKIGADGKMVVSSTGNKGGEVMIKLLANSKSAKFFMNVVTAQLVGGSVQWNGLYRDSRNGINVLLNQGYLTTAPLGPKIGKGDVANMEFVFTFERIIPDYSGANL